MSFQKAIDRALWQIAVDLSNTMPGEVQFQRLVSSIGSVLPCDAVSLMHLQEGTLVPMASTGLSPDLMGRRFDPAAHPRLSAILGAHNPVRFPADCEMPDPFDNAAPGLLADRIAIYPNVYQNQSNQCKQRSEGERHPAA